MLLLVMIAFSGCGPDPFDRTEGIEIRSDPELTRKLFSFSGALAVFVADGEVVRPLQIPELVFSRSAFSNEVVVEQGRRLVDPVAAPRPSEL